MKRNEPRPLIAETRFRRGGIAALEEKPVPGRPGKLTPAQVKRLYALVVGKNPLQLRFAYGLWTRAMIQELIWREWGVSLSESAVGRLLRRLGLSPQRPLFRAYQQSPEAVQRWKEVEFPAIQKLALKEGAEIGARMAKWSRCAGLPRLSRTRSGTRPTR